MILIFLGSWRSTIIIAVSIPLSILTSIIVLSALGETINIMTLGGLALAVGILVDDATVAIENINTQLESGKDLEPAILDGSQQIAIPAFVSTICICIVFVPMFFLTGVARYLFVPMAEAVVFAMLASYVLSRTLVPTMAKYLLHAHEECQHGAAFHPGSRNPFVLLQRWIDGGFMRLRDAYRRALQAAVDRRAAFAFLFLAGCVASLGLVRWVGEDFFPTVDSGQFKLHLRAPTGTRIEETAALCDHVQDTIRRVIPGNEIVSVIDNIGLPYSGINIAYTNSAPIGSSDADILVALTGSAQTTPTFWLNPATGVSYFIATQTPQYKIDSIEGIGGIPIQGSAPGAKPQLLESLASVSREAHMAVVTHFNVQPVIDIFGAVQGRDLGGVAREMTPILDESRARLPRGSQLVVRGQVETMQSSFVGLVAGIGLAIVLVYLLIVVNFQSWLDPFIIISASPAAIAGIVWILFLTHTTINVPSLTVAIMCMGVATANSILVVSFAKEQLRDGRAPADAAVDAGFTRFRPVLMTALAMIIGMVPMALGIGEGGGQNAPLGRAVIGGLTLATIATPFFV